MIHPAELNITPGMTCLALKCSLGRKRYMMKNTRKNIKNAMPKRISKNIICWLDRNG